MRRRILTVGAALLAISSTLALAQPENLLPGNFGNPAPEPTPTPAPRPSAQPTQGNSAPPAPQSTSSPVIQQVPGSSGSTSSSSTSSSSAGSIELPPGFPSLAELEAMEEAEVNELLGLKPKFDVPPAAQRAVARVGVIARSEGGFASASLAGQPAGLVRAALEGTRGPLVSRWGHILLRRALASRLDAPRGMDPVEFAALRASLLNRMGESQIARALVQDVDSANYDRALTDAAFDAYLGTGDLLGMCPVRRLNPTVRDDGDWTLIGAICDAYGGEQRSAQRRLERALGRGEAPAIDVRLAQRYAGAAADGNRAVTIEWDGVEELTPWRFALARSLGADLPDELREGASAGRRYDYADVLNPATPLLARVSAADEAGQSGLLSSAAMVDLYSQLFSSDAYGAGDKEQALQLREAYVASSPVARLAAMRSLWDAAADSQGGYGRQVLTAYAAARLPVLEDLQDGAGDIVASMLAAGLDRNAIRWNSLVDEGGQAWALLALASPQAQDRIGSGALDEYVDADGSEDQRKSRFLLAGLAGLDRIDSDTARDFAERLNVDLGRQSAWSQRIERAGAYGNPALVALLAGVGMQGTGWERMTARHLYHIVRALNRAGLSAEARMIAAEAVARA